MEQIYATIRKDDRKVLKEKVKELSEENSSLKKQLQDVLNEERRNQAQLHVKLQSQITQLEEDTKKEVSFLCERIRELMQEKKSLNDQIGLLQREREKLCQENKSKVSAHLHTKTVTEYKRLLVEMEQKYQEVNEQYEDLEKTRSSLASSLHEMRGREQGLESKIRSLESELSTVQQQRDRLLNQLEEGERTAHESDKLLLLLATLAENIVVEREMLLSKVSFQDNVQKELQKTMVDYTLHVGKLEEHISHANYERLQQLQRNNKRENILSGRLHENYDQQLSILREKIVQQNCTIQELDSDKKKLELNLENAWQLKDR